MAATKMTRKGQVTIPAEIREQLNLHEGDRFVVQAVDGKVVMESQRDIVRRTAGVFAKYAKHPPLEPSEERRLFEEGVAREVADSMANEQ
ncbi:MAG: AbrB/MazE/SpoVT family DNA-binding domain-containing protein [Chloroflexia bacterium]|nr:AbrB/MazE/SpoVT family DNA-binding domain-containing protein [Chloroflexia bacterium]